MAPRFDLIKFNLARAIEIFRDLNREDMDVSAPPSSVDLAKESELAEKLDIYVDKLIDDGFFDDCESRSSSDREENEIYGEDSNSGRKSDSFNSQRTTPRSARFEYETETASDNNSLIHGGSISSESSRRSHSRGEGGTGSNSGSSSKSFSDRFKRYIKRILPGRRSRS